MHVNRMKLAALSVLVTGTAFCATPGSDNVGPPYQTTFTTVGDTTIASTTGEVPENLLRHLTADWQSTGDSTGTATGDVADVARPRFAADSLNLFGSSVSSS